MVWGGLLSRNTERRAYSLTGVWSLKILRRSISALPSVFTAAALLMCCLFSGCAEDPYDSDDFDEGSYNIYSNGTSIHIEEEPELQQDGAFYIPEGMTAQYASERIPEEQQEIYYEIVESIRNFEPVIYMKTDSAVYSELLNIISIEQLSFGHMAGRRAGEYDVNTGMFPIEFTYRFTPEEMSNMNRFSEAAANRIMEGVTEDMSEYDILKYFHDYLIKNCVSDEEDIYANTIYGALVNGKALCEGYAKAFSYLCNKAGIENTIVTGMTNVPHMWNAVKLDGNWYHIDVTWDKPGGQFGEAFPDMVMYQYFLVTDSVIENDHEIWTVGTAPPQCLSEKENYFIKENLYVDSEEDMGKVIEAALSKAISEKASSVSVKFDTTNLYISAMNDLNDPETELNSSVKKEIEALSEEYGVKPIISWTDIYNYRIIVFILDYKQTP